MTHPTYQENRQARVIIARHENDPRSVTPAELAAAHATIRARSQYLSECHRNGPKWRNRSQRKANRIADPVQYALNEIKAHINYLRNTSDDPRVPGALAEVVDYIQWGA